MYVCMYIASLTYAWLVSLSVGEAFFPVTDYDVLHIVLTQMESLNLWHIDPTFAKREKQFMFWQLYRSSIDYLIRTARLCTMKLFIG